MLILSVLAFFVVIFLMAAITVAVAWMGFLKSKAEESDAARDGGSGEAPEDSPLFRTERLSTINFVDSVLTRLDFVEIMKTRIAQASNVLDRARNAGMEVGNQELALGEAQNQLIRARTEMHTFDPAAVERVTTGGVKIVAGVDRAGQGVLAELRYRRQGLAISLGVILIMVAALIMKIRQVDRRDS